MTFNAVPFKAPSQDFIKAGSTEIWEYINPNHDAHPMHVHLVNFQVLNRQPIDAAAYQADYEKWLDGGRKPEDQPVLANYLTGPPIPPDPDEALSKQGHGQGLSGDGDQNHHSGIQPADGYDRVDTGKRHRVPGDVHPPLPHSRTRMTTT